MAAYRLRSLTAPGVRSLEPARRGRCPEQIHDRGLRPDSGDRSVISGTRTRLLPMYLIMHPPGRYRVPIGAAPPGLPRTTTPGFSEHLDRSSFARSRTNVWPAHRFNPTTGDPHHHSCTEVRTLRLVTLNTWFAEDDRAARLSGQLAALQSAQPDDRRRKSHPTFSNSSSRPLRAEYAVPAIPHLSSSKGYGYSSRFARPSSTSPGIHSTA